MRSQHLVALSCLVFNFAHATATACKDINGWFLIKSIEANLGDRKNCQWVAENQTFERCQYAEISEACPYTCGKCTQGQGGDSIGRILSTSSCTDSTEKFYIESLKSKKTCDWAERRGTSGRCSRNPEVRENCPVTCGICETSSTTLPTEAPTIATKIPLDEGACEDNASKFRVGSEVNAMKWCSWATQKTNYRCGMENVSENCPVTCGMCEPSTTLPTAAPTIITTTPLDGGACEDNASKFRVGSPVNAMKWCSWATQKTDYRCGMENVSENCPVTCGICKPSTTLPTAAPTITTTTPLDGGEGACEDNASKFLVGSPVNAMKWCSWATQSTDYRCGLENVSENCPKTCDTCGGGGEVICVDSTERFRIVLLGKTQSCDWVARQDTVRKCNSYVEARANCRVSCGLCAAPSQFPSKPPTNFPTNTNSPSDSPTKSEFPTTSPSSSPTARPSFICNDVTEKFYVPFPVGGMKWCSWAENNLAERCAITEVKKSCPVTCLDCPNTPSALPSKSPAPSRKPSQHPSRVPTKSPSSAPSSKPSTVPSLQPSSMPSEHPSGRPSSEPSLKPSLKPSQVPSLQPSSSPSLMPSLKPSSVPSLQPSSIPSLQPSLEPSLKPSLQPSLQPSSTPSLQPSLKPSLQPSLMPSLQPSSVPSLMPSLKPSLMPSLKPSLVPSLKPSLQPSSIPSLMPSLKPSLIPSLMPSLVPSLKPSLQPSSQPSLQPSSQPSLKPSLLPSLIPSLQPSSMPSLKPSLQPSSQPSLKPSLQPSSMPSLKPSLLPSSEPSLQPSSIPSALPSLQPSSIPSLAPSLMPSSIPSSEPTACVDEQGWVTGGSDQNLPFANLPCASFTDTSWCALVGGDEYANDSKNVSQACCICGGSDVQSVAPSTFPSLIPSQIPSVTFSPSEHPSEFPSSEPSLSSSPSNDPTVTMQPSLIPSQQPSDCRNEPNWNWFTGTITLSCDQIEADPAYFCAELASEGIVIDGKAAYEACCVCGGGDHIPIAPSLIPSLKPSLEPSLEPSSQPSLQPSSLPSLEPSLQPSLQPSSEPSLIPSLQPSSEPSLKPSQQPSLQPSSDPSLQPSQEPSLQPSLQPSSDPSLQPSLKPSKEPSLQPSSVPSQEPSLQPSLLPSQEPSLKPSQEPSLQPSKEPSVQPSSIPSAIPSSIPSLIPSYMPSNGPSECVDEPGWEAGGNVDTISGSTCSDLGDQESWCTLLSDPQYQFESKMVTDACCLCGGSIHQSTVPSMAPSISSSPSACNDDPTFIHNAVPQMGCATITNADFCALTDLVTNEPAETACCVCINDTF